jgi:hypothetical protein
MTDDLDDHFLKLAVSCRQSLYHLRYPSPLFNVMGTNYKKGNGYNKRAFKDSTMKYSNGKLSLS